MSTPSSLPHRFQQIKSQLQHPDLSFSLLTFPSLSSLQRSHSLILTSGLAASSSFTLARLLACAASLHLPYAISLFSSLPSPSIFMFNTIIQATALSPSTPSPHPLHFYKHLLCARIVPDHLTFPFLLKACSSSPPPLGQSLHSHLVKLAMDYDVFVLNNAISMYSAWGDMASACNLFEDHLDIVDVVSWTAMVTGFSNFGQPDRARLFFDRSPTKNLVTWNAMVAGYARAGRAKEAREVFDEMPQRNVASWGSLVSGLAQAGLCEDALSTFNDMVWAGVSPNEATHVSVVSACAQLRALEKGEWVFRYVESRKQRMSLTLATAFVDMYGKCGCIGKAIRVFNEMPVKNVYSWNSMISGLANNGLGKQALSLFWKMRLAGIEPNDVTFIGLLSACAHSGLVDEGRWFFDLMTGAYGIRPSEEHYGCMVDLLARAGMIKEAVGFMDGMPVEPHPGLLGALAGACKIHGELEIGEEVAKRLIELEPQHGGRYVLLANMYAAAKRWDDMSMVRKMLKAKKAAKVAGNSSVESGNSSVELQSVAK